MELEPGIRQLPWGRRERLERLQRRVGRGGASRTPEVDERVQLGAAPRDRLLFTLELSEALAELGVTEPRQIAVVGWCRQIGHCSVLSFVVTRRPSTVCPAAAIPLLE